MKDIVARVSPDETDVLECDLCSLSDTEPVIFIVSKWDTEQEEYYVSDILCGPHKEEHY